MTWASALPLDVLVRNPTVEYPFLYNFSKLLDKHPVRISISVKNGFVKAVRLALALGFSVKLEVGQPDASLIGELDEVLDLYLHRSEVSQPVEYFHSTFLSFFNRKQSSNLWSVQEEDPEQYRFISNEGVETVSPRFGELDWKELKPTLAAQSTMTECDGCEFLEPCGGYFKWPNKEFDCEGVKALFSSLSLAAEELRNDLASFRELPGMMKNHLSVIFLPTNKCNVNCEYCFEDKTADRMSLEQLSTVTVKLLDFMDESRISSLTLHWQGGEIMTMPVGWFEQAHESISALAQARNKRVDHGLQTNMIAYTPRWNRIIKEMFGNSVGTSMDYPNLYRKMFRGGPDDYTRIWKRNIQAAREAGINVGVISVPNRETLKVGS